MYRRVPAEVERGRLSPENLAVHDEVDYTFLDRVVLRYHYTLKLQGQLGICSKALEKSLFQAFRCEFGNFSATART